MKCSDYIKRNGMSLGGKVLLYLGEHDTMAQAWDACNDIDMLDDLLMDADYLIRASVAATAAAADAIAMDAVAMDAVAMDEVATAKPSQAAASQAAASPAAASGASTPMIAKYKAFMLKMIGKYSIPKDWRGDYIREWIKTPSIEYVVLAAMLFVSESKTICDDHAFIVSGIKQCGNPWCPQCK